MSEPEYEPRQVRATDVNSLRFTLKDLIFILSTIIGACGAAAGGQWAMNKSSAAETAEIRSQLNKIDARMSAQEKIDQMKAQLEEERSKNQNMRLDAFERRLEFLRIETQEIKERIAGRGGR